MAEVSAEDITEEALAAEVSAAEAAISEEGAETLAAAELREIGR